MHGLKPVTLIRIHESICYTSICWNIAVCIAGKIIQLPSRVSYHVATQQAHGTTITAFKCFPAGTMYNDRSCTCMQQDH